MTMTSTFKGSAKLKQPEDQYLELVHDGRLIGSRFAGPNKVACVQVVADVLNWIDAYQHAGPTTRPGQEGVLWRD
jgi:hypothetical protein